MDPIQLIVLLQDKDRQQALISRFALSLFCKLCINRILNVHNIMSNPIRIFIHNIQR